MTLDLPAGGPVGFFRGPVTWKVAENQSRHHSHTLPETLKSPKPLGGNESTGAVPAQPSLTVFLVGNSPCQMLHRCSWFGVSVSPQGWRLCSRPPLAAYSHSASVGSLLP